MLKGEILKIHFSEMERMMQSGKSIQSVELERRDKRKRKAKQVHVNQRLSVKCGRIL